MNRKEAVLVTVLLLATFVGTVFADTATTSRTTTTLQTASVDIFLFAGPFASGNNALVFASSTLHQNLSAAFSFTPSRVFVQVNAALLTYHYSVANPNAGDKFSFQLNRGSPTVVPIGTVIAAPLSEVVNLQGANLRIGSNVVELGIMLAPGVTGGSVNVFGLRLTVEYTFMA